MRRGTRIIGAFAATLLAGGLLAVAAPAQARQTASVSILHAVPGPTVDVYANGQPLVTDFKPGTLTDPQDVPADTYDLKVVAAGDGAGGKALISANGVEVPAGANITVVAHLDAQGNPILTPFVNDVSAVDAGDARLTVRHTAAAPAVDVRADGQPVFEGLTNPNEDSATVPAGTVSADVTLAGTDTVAIGPADLDLQEGTNTIVYAWGSADDDNLDLAVQTISGLHSPPSSVPGGTGGQAADTGSGSSMLPLGVMAAALVGVAASVARLRGAGTVRR